MSLTKITDEIMDIENRIKPLLPLWVVIIACVIASWLGAIGIVAVIFHFAGASSC